MREKITSKLLAKLKPQDAPYNVEDTELRGFALRVEPTGRMAYFVRYRVNGRQSQMKLAASNVLNVAQAREQARKALGDVARGIDPVAKRRTSRVATLGDFLEKEYQPTVLAHKKSGEATAARLKACFTFLWARNLNDATLCNAVVNWRSKRLKEGTKPTTANRDVAALRAALSWGVDSGFLKVHPLEKIHPEKTDKAPKVRYLDPAEEKRLLAALDAREEKIRAGRDSANAWRRERGYEELPDLRALAFADHLKPMVLVSLNTGLRRGELFSLSWRDVSLDKGMLTVRGDVAKSGSTRHVPLSPVALDVLGRWQGQTAGDGLVFPSGDGSRFDNVNSSWRQVLKDAKVTGFRWHDMRHTFASNLVHAGVDLYTVRELLGHSTIAMTEKYAHLRPEKLADAVARLGNGAPNVVPFQSQAGGAKG